MLANSVMFSPDRQRATRTRRMSCGTMLIELMVGLGVATIAIGAAIASLAVARDAALTVNEIALLQQRASHALRVMGLQIRPAGSLELQTSPADSARFRFVTQPTGSTDVSNVQGTDGGSSGRDSLRLSQTSPPLLPSSYRRNCLGQEVAPGARMEALFQVDAKGSLRCKGGPKEPQPIVAGVAGFKLRYRVRQGDQVRSMHATEVEAAGLWPAVTALEVCLEIRGEQRTAGFERHYIDCMNRSTTSGNYLTLVTRKVFALNALPGA